MILTLVRVPGAAIEQYTVDTVVGQAVVTPIVTRPTDGYGNYIDGGDDSLLLHDIEIETTFSGQKPSLYYGHADLDAALSRLSGLVEQARADSSTSRSRGKPCRRARER